MTSPIKNIAIIVLCAVLMVSCKKATVDNTLYIPIVPMDALYDKAAQQIVMYSASGDIVAYDLKNNKILNQIATNAQPGYCDIGTYNGTKELYVPRTDGWLFIYDEATLAQIDQIYIGNQLFSVVANNGILYVSGANSYNNTVYAYNRADKSKISEATMGDHLHIKMIPGSNTELFGTSSYDGYYLKFDTSGHHVTTYTTFTSPSAWNMQLGFDVLGIYPDGSNYITGYSGYVINKNLDYVCTLPHGSYTFSSFDFDPVNRQIYAGSTQKGVLVYSMDTYQLTKTLVTRGIPKKVFYDNGTVIAVSLVMANRATTNQLSQSTIVEQF